MPLEKDRDKNRLAIIGGGIAGLSTGYFLSKQDIKVTIFEKDSVLGGLARSFPLVDGPKIERYYHFICKGDYHYINLLKEFGLDGRLHWVKTTMGQFYNGRLYSFGKPLDLILFPEFSFRDKLKFGYRILLVKRQRFSDWKHIENMPAYEWLKNTFGNKAFAIIHKPLIELKFGHYADKLSAAWIWARIHRVGKSRTWLTQREVLGYLDGGTQTLVNALEREILANRGQIKKSAAIEKILVERNKVTGLVCNGQTQIFDTIISTIPSPVFLNLINNPSDEYFYKLSQIDSIGIICILLRLNRPLSKYFWANISDIKIQLAGIIEYTNLNPCYSLNGDSILYLPQYLPPADDRFSSSDKDLLERYISFLKFIKPGFDENWIKEYYVFREKYAQPICELGFTKFMPTIETPIQGLYMTDSCQLHPDDRTVSNSIGLGKKAAALIFQRKHI